MADTTTKMSAATQQQIQEINDIASEEEARILTAQRLYSLQKHARPVKRRVSFWSMIGVDVGALFASAVGSTFVSATRVMMITYIAEELLVKRFGVATTLFSSNLPYVIAVSSLLAFDGMLLAHGYSKGKKSKKLTFSNWALVTAFLVTCFSGLLSSLSLAEAGTIFDVVQGFVILFTGVGSPIISYFGAQNIGVMHTLWLAELEKAQKEFEAEDEAWKSAATTWYNQRTSQQLFNVDRTLSKQGPKEPDQKEMNIAQELRALLVEKGITADAVGEGASFVTTPAALASELSTRLGIQVKAGTIRATLFRDRKKA